MMRRWLVLLVVALLVMPSAAIAQEASPTLKHGVKVLYSPERSSTPADGLRIQYFDVVGIESDCRVNCDQFAFVFGVAKNTTEVTYDFPEMVAVFLDADQNIVGSAYLFGSLVMIEAGKTTTFEGSVYYVSVPEFGWSSVEIQVTGAWGTQYSQDRWNDRPLSLEDVDVTEHTADDLKLAVTVRNNGDIALRPYVAVAIYTEDGRYRGHMISLDLNDVSVPPGKTIRVTFRSDYQPHENLWYAGSDYEYKVIVL